LDAADSVALASAGRALWPKGVSCAHHLFGVGANTDVASGCPSDGRARTHAPIDSLGGVALADMLADAGDGAIFVRQRAKTQAQP